MKQKIYITTPIYYVNGNPHVGHAHTSVMGDILKREALLNGMEVYFTTGVDEHGQKNETSIRESGLTSEAYLEQKSSIFRSLFDQLNVQYDRFVRTSAEAHKSAVQYVLQKVYDKGLIVKKEYEGLYCVGCEMFKTNADLDKNGFCVDHQTKPILMKESNYFFNLGAYQSWLIAYITDHPDWIQPNHFRNEILNLLKEPLPDLCISRPKSRCSLGIELPFDRDYVTYVWFDALISYISSLGYPNLSLRSHEFWLNSTHLMAKDIIKTHCIYWPIMLKAIDLEPQNCNLVHGYWTGAGGIKMSKSIGNVVDPQEVINKFGVDPFRYFLARTMGEGESPMSMDLIKNCYNAEIVNTISNGLYRVMKLAYKEFGGICPKVSELLPDDQAFLDSIIHQVQVCMEHSLSLSGIYERAKMVFAIGKMINGYFDKKTPWILAKDTNRSAFNSCILTCMETLRLLAELCYPIMPETSDRMLLNLGVTSDWHIDYKIKNRVFTANFLLNKPIIMFKRME